MQRTWELYERVYNRTLYNYSAGLNKNKDIDYKDYFKKLIFYGMNKIALDDEEPETLSEAQFQIEEIKIINMMIANLTPRQFITVFPVKKYYKGEKYNEKDYFFTMEYIKKIGLDTEIGENTSEFLWNYYNNIIADYLIKEITCLDMIKTYKGEPTFLDTFAELNNLKTYNKYEYMGTQFIYDSENRKISKISKPKRYGHLRVIK